MEFISNVLGSLSGGTDWILAVLTIIAIVIAGWKGGIYLKWWLVAKRVGRAAYEAVEDEFGEDVAKGIAAKLFGFEKLAPYMKHFAQQLDKRAAEKFKSNPTAQALAAKEAARLAKNSPGSAAS